MAVEGMVALHMVEANYQLPAQTCHILTNSRLSTICQRRFFLTFFLLYASETRSTISHLPSVYVPIAGYFYECKGYRRTLLVMHSSILLHFRRAFRVVATFRP